jgi:hypothetical protein
LLNFPIMFALALNPVLGRVPVFLFFALYAFVLLRLSPYQKQTANLINGLLAALNALHAFFYGLVAGSTAEQIMMVMIALAAGTSAALYYKRREQMEALLKKLEGKVGRGRGGGKSAAAAAARDMELAATGGEQPVEEEQAKEGATGTANSD